MEQSGANGAVEAQGLCVEIGGAAILRDAAFTIPEGGRTAIIGPNGAGKSTLLRTLAGLQAPSAGRALLLGGDTRRLSPRAIARRAAYVPQSLQASIPYPVTDFMLMARYARFEAGRPGPKDHDAVREALDDAGIGALAGRMVNTLSGGERQLVLAAAALAQEAPILLLDEPAAFLDYRRQMELLDLLARVHTRRQLTVVSVTHDLNLGVFESDQAIALREGRIAFDGPPAGLLEPGALAALYDAEFDVMRPAGRTAPVVAPRRIPA